MNLPRPEVFCDTSFFFASLCQKDSNFDKAGEALEYCNDNAVGFYTTWDIVSETATLLRYRADYRLAVRFLEEIKPCLNIVQYENSVRMEAEDVFKKLSGDKQLSFCDAVSFVVITTMLDNIPCLSFDRDFKSLGLTVFP